MTIARNNFDYFCDGVKAVRATITRRKGRGAERQIWRGAPWEATLAAFSIGAVFAGGMTWTVTLALANGGTVNVPYGEFLKIEE